MCVFLTCLWKLRRRSALSSMVALVFMSSDRVAGMPASSLIRDDIREAILENTSTIVSRSHCVEYLNNEDHVIVYQVISDKRL